MAAPRAAALDPLVVTAAAPTDRQARASGVRLDVLRREEIQEYRGVALHVGDLVRRIPSVAVEEQKDGFGTIVSGVCVRHARQKYGVPCAAVVIDDVLTAAGAEALARLEIGDVESIEFVPPVVARPRYGSQAEGGALLVYTVGNGPHARRSGQ
jgi:outer membrane cobalamin receptor